MRNNPTVRPLGFRDWRAQMIQAIAPDKWINCPYCEGGCEECYYEGELRAGDIEDLGGLTSIFDHEMYAAALVMDLVDWAHYVGSDPETVLREHGVGVHPQDIPRTLLTLTVMAGKQLVKLERHISYRWPKNPELTLEYWAAAG